MRRLFVIIAAFAAAAASADDAGVLIAIRRPQSEQYQSWWVARLGVSLRARKLPGQIWMGKGKDLIHMGRTQDRRIYFGPAGKKPTLLDLILSPGRQIMYASPRAFSLAQMQRTGPDPEYATLFLDPPGKRAVLSDFIGDRREEILLALEKRMSGQDELPALNEISDFQLSGPDSSVYAHSMIWNEGGRAPFIQCPELRMSKEQRRIADKIAPSDDHKTSMLAWTVFNETAELALVSGDDGVRIRSLKRQRLSNELKYVRQMQGSVIAATWFLGDEAWDMNDRIRNLKPIDPTG